MNYEEFMGDMLSEPSVRPLKLTRKPLKHILFDLDGTLLPLHMNQFSARYFELLAQSGVLDLFRGGMDTYMRAFHAMAMNDGSMSNMERFLSTLEELSGTPREVFIPPFNVFLSTGFLKLKDVCFDRPDGARAVKLLRDKGYDLILATAPVFPADVTRLRMDWAGLDADMFSYVTSYENSTYSKPSLGYYREICQKLDVDPAAAMMVGNSVTEDLVAMNLGFDAFFVDEFGLGDFTEGLCSRGDLSAFLDFAKALPDR